MNLVLIISSLKDVKILNCFQFMKDRMDFIFNEESLDYISECFIIQSDFDYLTYSNLQCIYLLVFIPISRDL